MNKPDPNSYTSIAKRCGLSRVYVSKVARGLEKASPDTPRGRKLSRILASRRPVAAGN
ncbi:MAG: hypothetical protein IJ783_08960 [Kiritimatiellae bacterium]|nr:hypothetical protein [Kiritimatiellia bacterium]